MAKTSYHLKTNISILWRHCGGMAAQRDAALTTDSTLAAKSRGSGIYRLAHRAPLLRGAHLVFTMRKRSARRTCSSPAINAYLYASTRIVRGSA